MSNPADTNYQSDIIYQFYCNLYVLRVTEKFNISKVGGIPQVRV